MNDLPHNRESVEESATRVRMARRVVDIARREVAVVIPAAIRAAKHAGTVFLKRFPAEYAKERRKR